MIKGKILNYVKTKGYGFILGDDGENYFFHKNDILKKNDFNNLIVNNIVFFEPSASPKGLKAIKINLNKVYIAKTLTEFQKTKNNEPKIGKVVDSYRVSTRKYQDLKETKKELNTLVAMAGGNAALNVQYIKTEEHSGNYIYSAHRYTFDVAIIFEEVICESKDKMNELNNEFNDDLLIFESKKEKTKEWVENHLNPTLFKNAKLFKIVFLFIFLILFFKSFNYPLLLRRSRTSGRTE